MIKVMVRPVDVRRAGFCATGVRDWLNENGFDFRTFVRDGIPVEDVLARGDALGDIAVKHAKERSDGR